MLVGQKVLPKDSMALYPSYPETINVKGYYDSRSGWKNDFKGQARYLPVTAYERTVTHATNMKVPRTVADHNRWFGARDGFDSNSHRLAFNKAYEKFIDGIKGDSSSLGNAVGEWRDSVNMIARRAITIRKAWKKVRAGDPFGAIEALTIPDDTKYRIKEALVRKDYVRPGSKRGHMRVRRDKFVSTEHYVSSMWLEMYFGFLPLMGDIHDSLKVLSDPIRNLTKVSGTGANQRHVSDRGYFTTSGTALDQCRIFAEVRINNPNLALAERMGLVNPLAIAWELVPFSFVVDWFTNVGQIAESVTDLAGITILRGGVTRKTRGSGTLVESDGSTVWNSFGLTTMMIQRSPGISTPELAFRNPLGDWKRAATQISLLVQLFIKPR